jgi:hypothetical protein
LELNKEGSNRMKDYNLTHYKLNRNRTGFECDYHKEIHLLRDNNNCKIDSKTTKIVFSLFTVLCVSLFIFQTPQPVSNQVSAYNETAAT